MNTQHWQPSHSVDFDPVGGEARTQPAPGSWHNMPHAHIYYSSTSLPLNSYLPSHCGPYATKPGVGIMLLFDRNRGRAAFADHQVETGKIDTLNAHSHWVQLETTSLSSRPTHAQGVISSTLTIRLLASSWAMQCEPWCLHVAQ
ncbi:hypothetical protein EYF80_016775 [Liparis tanakae]|uniref:Uncharacterized protein n=1 Tax=Liparis tanakae TaxID=230148 RepID=A0A4Z2I699_9TELE|nr:hypothetical protein EYF80_016775 [Liparis tanakae]